MTKDVQLEKEEIIRKQQKDVNDKEKELIVQMNGMQKLGVRVKLKTYHF